MPRKSTIFKRLFVLALALAATASAQQPSPAELRPFPPFRIAGNLYYVGSADLANYLVVTPAGNILINSDFPANLPLIKGSIEKLGFKFGDTKILLISHAHDDHDSGSAAVIRETGAKYMVMDADVPVVESGGKADFQYGATVRYAPAKVDRVLHDGDEVALGGTTLVAHLTPGHTAQDYERAWSVLKSLPCDIFLGAHGSYFDLEEKYARMKPGAPNPFIDPDGYKAYVAHKERDFYAELAKQQAAAR